MESLRGDSVDHTTSCSVFGSIRFGLTMFKSRRLEELESYGVVGVDGMHNNDTTDRPTTERVTRRHCGGQLQRCWLQTLEV